MPSGHLGKRAEQAVPSGHSAERALVTKCAERARAEQALK